ncbi:hypothetical protein WAI453_002775 [Rhynchosporium graminicola]
MEVQPRGYEWETVERHILIGLQPASQVRGAIVDDRYPSSLTIFKLGGCYSEKETTYFLNLKRRGGIKRNLVP